MKPHYRWSWEESKPVLLGYWHSTHRGKELVFDLPDWNIFKRK